jgi:hypothetical protein
MNSEKFWITNDSKSAAYNKAITVFMQKTRIILNTNLPENTVEGAAINCNVKDVPLSSSDTNARARPDIAVKNITTQNNPPANPSDIFSCPTANRITLIATIINIASEFIA